MSVTEKLKTATERKFSEGKFSLSVYGFLEQFRAYAENSRLTKIPFLDKDRIRIRYYGDVCCPITFLYYCKRFIYLEPEKYLTAASELGLDLGSALRIVTAADHPFELGTSVSMESMPYIRAVMMEVLKLHGQ